MYDELIKSLRVCASSGLPDSCLECPRFENGCDTLREDAADAIEHMQKTILRLENELGIYDDLPMVDQSMALSKMEKTTQWIPVTERLPYESVFVHGKGGELIVAQYSHKHKWWEDDEGYYCDTNYVTHWMPLPEPPKEET